MCNLSSGVVCKLEFNTRKTFISEECTIQGSIMIYLRKKLGPIRNTRWVEQGGFASDKIYLLVNKEQLQTAQVWYRPRPVAQ